MRGTRAGRLCGQLWKGFISADGAAVTRPFEDTMPPEALSLPLVSVVSPELWAKGSIATKGPSSRVLPCYETQAVSK